MDVVAQENGLLLCTLLSVVIHSERYLLSDLADKAGLTKEERPSEEWSGC